MSTSGRVSAPGARPASRAAVGGGGYGDEVREEQASSAATSRDTGLGAEPGMGAAPAPGQRRVQRIWTLYACFFLLFLVFPLQASWAAGGWQRWLGPIAVAAFCAWYVGGYVSTRFAWRADAGWRQPGMATWIAGMLAATAFMTIACGPSGLSGLAYVACGCAVFLPSRAGLGAVILSGFLAALAGLAIGMELPWGPAIGVWIIFIGLAVWGSALSSRTQEALVAAREEKAGMAVELERTRLARDLHDILGHSLTVITVKTELAGRLVDLDPTRAKAEIAEVERLAREALADVRTTVSGYRELSLATELARARTALADAGIAAHLPGSVDETTHGARDLFAWVLREGVTNVIRHSRAHGCWVTLGPGTLEIRDDGPTRGDTLPGNGLTGIRERARQAGARVTAGAIEPHGFLLRVTTDAADAEGKAMTPATPDRVAPDALAPDAVATDVVAPDSGTSRPITPDVATRHPLTPDAVTPDAVTTEEVTARTASEDLP